MKVEMPYNCGLGPALNVIGGKWKAGILWEVYNQPVRFGELKRRLPGISEKVLFEQLREMEADGIISRKVFDEVPLRVEYFVTEAGAALNDAVHAVAEWGKKHAPEFKAAARLAE
jgi:DNA-binding HxlR family transcriptional regulator